MAYNTAKTVILKSSDHIEFVVSEAAAMKMKTVSHVIEDDCAQMAIPLFNVESKILTKVIDYCTKHVTVDEETAERMISSEEELKMWDENFLNVQDLDTLYDLLLAAHYLEIPDLLDLLCQKVAGKMSGKKPEELRQIFNITNDFTPEEEEEIRRDNAWVFA